MSRRSQAILIITCILVLLIASPFVVWGVWNAVAWRRLNAAIADLKRRGEPTTLDEMLPSLVPPDLDAAVLYQRAGDLAGCINSWQTPATPGPAFSLEELAEAQQLMSSCEEIFELIRHRSLRPGHSWRRKPIPTIPGAYLPDTAGLRALARLLALSSRVNLTQGRPDNAFEDALTIFHTVRGLEQEPLFIAAIVEISVSQLALRQFRFTLDAADVSESRLRAAQLVLQESIHPGRIASVLKGERAFAILAASEVGNDDELSNRSLLAWLVHRPSALGQTLDYIQELNFLAPFADLPWYRAKPAIERIRGPLPESFSGPHNMTIPFIGMCNIHLARIHLARSAIALRLYRMKHGAYPDSLATLAPEFLEELPVDPFSGEQFVYHKEGAGFIIYSLGINLTDDGGTEDPKDRLAGDIVWKCSR